MTKREEDARYAFVEINVDVELEIEPRPDDLRALLDRAERDCFVGASLRPYPRYTWRVV